ncbi:uncharacterized protein [Solanum tuberosum]|uniref:RNA-directed DNA polymerase (Reverse transcriptase) n=2 Tax=Solanum tuberosum TaxID=4113 RepID=M1A811_SOLTU|nr:PREDICTED: uncharacterized protein LOC102581206 [Solanum tuberosum]
MTKSHQVTTFANFKSFPRTCVKSVMLILKPPSIFSLTIAQNLWNQLNIPISPIVNDHSIVNWLLTLKNLNHAFADPLLSWEIYFPFAIWHIWLNRNNNIFHNSNSPISIPTVIARTLEYAFTGKFLSSTPSDKITIHARWKPPPHGLYKLNFDGFFSAPSLVGGLGGVFRDEYGNWKMGFYQQHQGFNGTSMELLALLRGIELAYHHNLFHWQSKLTLLRYWLKKLQNPPINHNFRDGNKVEHHLANEARTTSTNSNFVMFCSPLTGVISSLAADVAGHISTKKVSLATCINLAKLGNYNILTVSAT